MMFAFKKPIRDPSENSLMMCALAVTFFNLLIGAVSRIPTEGVLLSVDAYMDNELFTVVVIGANVSVIGILVCKYLFLSLFLILPRLLSGFQFSLQLAGVTLENV